MANPPSNALVPSGGGNRDFQQQGSLDWVALANTQYSMSIAVLGRLSKAGVDTLTVAFGQAMCSRLPIGSHGERVLKEAMSNVTAKSLAADLLWFGIGVRHITRDLVQTSQGCSLVALCAALAEGHTIKVSALVMYEIARVSGGPQDLSPSLEQWEALVQAAAAIFSATTFGPRMYQIARCGTMSSHGSLESTPAPHPTDLASAILLIGQVVLGDLQSVSLEGDKCCSWIAAWADFVLGLRVRVTDANDSILYANHDPEIECAQIDVKFVAETSGHALRVQTSHSVRSGADFIDECFHGQDDVYFGHKSFRSGRLQWQTKNAKQRGLSHAHHLQ
ncbi:hypothetical protein NX059_002758 [Plenodomus lindquistii]|nr:hypothetical protein NX059_002758 [Plenodomus lindquistii]